MGVSSLLMLDDKMVGNTYPSFVSVRNISRSSRFHNKHALVLEGRSTDFWPGPHELPSRKGRDAYSKTHDVAPTSKSRHALACGELSQVSTCWGRKGDVPSVKIAALDQWWLNKTKGPPCGEENAKQKESTPSTLDISYSSPAHSGN